MGQDRGDGRSRAILETVGFGIAINVSTIGIHGLGQPFVIFGPR